MTCKRQQKIMEGLVICGNLDPVTVFLQGTPEDVYQGVIANAKAGGSRWISAGGCEIPDETAHRESQSTKPSIARSGSQGMTDPYKKISMKPQAISMAALWRNKTRRLDASSNAA
jgi:hypothetical protein